MKFLFIINPNAGTTKKKKVITHIHAALPINDFDIIYWNAPKQDIVLDIKNNINNVDIVVAVGGDGTVNVVAQALINTDTVLGIIPSGSGNGLARYLGIPLEIKKAIASLYAGNTITIDTCLVNDKRFLSTCGVGFDAQVSSLFSHSSKRGFWSYACIAFNLYWKYKLEEYKLIIDKKSMYKKAFLITFANSSQFGNNAIIAPKADIQDGIMDIIIVKSFPFYHMIPIGIKLFNNTIHHSKYVETLQVKSVRLIKSKAGVVQYDGEPTHIGKILDVKIVPKSLKVSI